MDGWFTGPAVFRSMEVSGSGENPFLAGMTWASQQLRVACWRNGTSSRHFGNPSHHGATVVQPISNDMDDTFWAALQTARYQEKAAAQHGAAEAVQQAGPNHDIGDTGLILDRAEHNIPIAGTLTHQHNAGDAKASAICLDGSLGTAHHTFVGE